MRGLDQRITLEAPSRTRDAGGGLATTWAPLARDARPWARVALGAGTEGELGSRQVARQVATFTIRARGDLDTSFRIQWGGVTWNITAIAQPVARAPYLTIHASSGALST